MSIQCEISKYKGTSKKSGKEFDAFQLKIGDYETLLFPTSRMERNYLIRLIDEGEI